MKTRSKARQTLDLAAFLRQHEWLNDLPAAEDSVDLSVAHRDQASSFTVSGDRSQRELPQQSLRGVYNQLPVRFRENALRGVAGSLRGPMWSGATSSPLAVQDARSCSKPSVLALLVLLIAGISVHDAMLLVLNRAAILDFEKNPLAHWLIVVADGDVRPLVVLKLVCTAAVCAIVLTIHERKARIGLGVAGGLAFLQMALLLYLCIY